jgi:hypothetical protein
LVEEAAEESKKEVEIRIYREGKDRFPDVYGPLIPPVVVVGKKYKLKEMRKELIKKAIESCYE